MSLFSLFLLVLLFCLTCCCCGEEHQQTSSSPPENFQDGTFPNVNKEESAESTSDHPEDSIIVNDNKKLDSKTPGPVYRVLKAEEGGWKPSDVGAPFTVGDVVYCHKDMTKCSSNEGVDFMSNEKTIVCQVEMADASLLRVKCGDDEKSRLISGDCCETVLYNDTSVYATPLGLIHYATWGTTEPLNVAIGMKMLEQRYQTELKRRYNNVPVLFLYYADWDEWDDKKGEYNVDDNIPYRVELSSLYNGPYHRSLLRKHTATMHDSKKLAMRVRALGLNVRGGPFLVTYFTLKEALEAVQEPSTQFVVTRIDNDYGSGIHVQDRDVLQALWEKNIRIQGSQVVVQELITDAAKIVGREFDIKFYILIHAGRVYIHQNAEIVLMQREVFSRTQVQPASNSSEYDYSECVNSFLSKYSSGEEKRWQEAIFAQLVASLPVLEPVIRATTEEENDGMLYHIFSGRAIIRENGEAHVLSYHDWPVVDYPETGYDDASCDSSTTQLTPEERRLAYESTLSEMYEDFFSIVLGLANTTSITDDSVLDGRVREVLGFRFRNPRPSVDTRREKIHYESVVLR